MTSINHLPLFSIIICTYNRFELVRTAIESVLAQDYPQEKYELIVVDNASTDDTQDVIQQFIAKGSRINYIYEDKKGLSNARNRGFQEAKGAYIGYIDDDSRVSQQWLKIAEEIINNIFPPAFGGPCYPYYISIPPIWFEKKYGSYIVNPESGYLSKDQFLFGGNIFFRREILIKFGGFDPNLGMKGSQIGYGEETALLERIREQQGDNQIYYDPRLFVDHLVRPEKMQFGWIIRNKFIDGREYYKIFPEKIKATHPVVLVMKIIKNLVLMVLDIPVCALFRGRNKYHYYQNYLYEHTTKYISALGVNYEHFRKK